jgi:hypothetical protein
LWETSELSLRKILVPVASLKKFTSFAESFLSCHDIVLKYCNDIAPSDYVVLILIGLKVNGGGTYLFLTVRENILVSKNCDWGKVMKLREPPHIVIKSVPICLIFSKDLWL